MMIAYMFPGQGSQEIGMGLGLFEEFAELTAIADRKLGYSVRDLCCASDGSLLNQTQYTQPALFVVNALCYLNKVRETGRRPDHVVGHSLGEYNALCAAGVFDFETGLELVQKRSELMAQARGGAMAAVIGLEGEKVKRILLAKRLDRIDLANLNSPVQTVISGMEADVMNAQPVFEELGARAYIRLKVSGAFHSRYMAAARSEFEMFIRDIAFREPQIPVISNVTASPYTKITVKQVLCDQITHAVNWTGGIQYLLEKGTRKFEEVGPGFVLTALVRQIANTFPTAVQASGIRPTCLQI